LDPAPSERRAHDGRLEVLGVESADPRWVKASIESLLDTAYRLRALGTIAVSLCQVAAARFDGMVSLRRARGVDSAAGQLIVREAGGVVSFPSFDDPLAALLDPVLASTGKNLGPLKPALQIAFGLVVSTEVGVVLGYLAQRVLGQYELVLLDEAVEDRPPRLLFVLPNLGQAVQSFGAEEK